MILILYYHLYPQKEGLTPLHMVANDADDAWVRFLQTHGANPDVGDNQERTPLYYMVEKGSHRRVDYMIEKFGASINTRTKVRQISTNKIIFNLQAINFLCTIIGHIFFIPLSTS